MPPSIYETYDFLLKFIIIGESGTGKSCLLHHFIENKFKETSQHTIGVEFQHRIINVVNRSIKLQIWDTAGQERFRSVTRSYYRGAAGALLVYDVSNRSTFLSLSKWLSDARSLASSDLVIVLIGNKCDKEENRQVSWEEGNQYANENNLLFLESSAQNGDNVEECFFKVAKSILTKIEMGQLDPEKAGGGIQYGDSTIRRFSSIYKHAIPPSSFQITDSQNFQTPSNSLRSKCCGGS